MITTVTNFKNRLLNENIFEDETFDLNDQTVSINRLMSGWIILKDCTFNCKTLEFKKLTDNNLTLKFQNCTFNCNISFSDCTFESLSFKNTKVLNSLEINNLELHDLVFSNDLDIEKPQLTSEFTIRKSNINFLLFEKLNHIQGKLLFLGNKFGEKNGASSFQNSTITNVLFGNNSFFNFTHFKRVTFKSTREYSKPRGSAFEFPGFYKTSFEKISFSQSNFKCKLQFENCDFLSTSWFEECNNINDSELRFVACKFEKYSLFDNSKFNRIEILHSKFKEKASFENFETNYFKIHQVTFAEAAYFDDLNKSNEKVIENWDRKTLRAIKRELVNTHNQIDYLRFKAYELNAYKKEKGKNWKDNLILFLNENSNYFGLDWTKGICFILKTSLMFYLLYLISFIIGIKDSSYLPQSCEEFLVIYIKFLNPVSFLKTPIEEAESYFFPLLFLNLSKIFVSYGIYQTIQAFRKFGVNGG
ncbi:hypothetical protein ACSV4D_10360 [Flavobacterium sp. ARAG 55.4]|uniref:hypothetical protein n=1 Tax=Flavobacterium sp. ARAG 55.4 TaxID=3451357 RepID=UPI003F46B8DC